MFTQSTFPRLTPDETIAIELVLASLALILFAGRAYVTRRISQTRESVVALSFIFVTTLAGTAATSMCVWLMFEEKQLLKRYDGRYVLAMHQEVKAAIYEKVTFLCDRP
jgi:NhaP-type Na+/H+ or K+/H+ antiporter